MRYTLRDRLSPKPNQVPLEKPDSQREKQIAKVKKLRDRDVEMLKGDRSLITCKITNLYFLRRLSDRHGRSWGIGSKIYTSHRVNSTFDKSCDRYSDQQTQNAI